MASLDERNVVGRRIETFEVRVAKPADWRSANLAADLGFPLRWAVVRVDGEELLIAGVRLCSS